MNKHGGQAFSVTGHTRHFYPVGHGVKINHYFPEKDHSDKTVYTTETESEENVGKPVIEAEEPKIKGDSKIMFIEGGEDANVMMLKPVTFDIKSEDNEVKPLVKAEETSVKVVPAVVSIIMPTEKANEEMTLTGAEDFEDQVSKNTLTLDEGKKTEKEESTPDSEVASSYYHSRIYYVGF